MSQFKSQTALTLLIILVMISLIILTIPGCSSQNKIPPEIDKYSTEWPLANMDYSNTRATENSGITSQNIDELGIAWTFDIPGVGEWGASATNPLILDDTVYLQDLKSNVYAFDLETGDLKWKKEYDLNNFGPNGPAVGWGKLFIIKGRYDITALDIKNGDEIWTTRLSDIESTGIDIQLVAYNNLVYASTVPGSSNANFYTGGGMGIIYALDQKTGDIRWEFNTIDSEDIWGNPEVNSGGGAWYPPAIDVETGIMYWGTGNPAPWPGTEAFPNGSSRPGDNLYTNSMLALDSATGELLWYNQVLPHDLFDLDFQTSPILTSATINNKETQIVIGSGKLGKVYAFDRQTGEIYWETPVGQHQNDDLEAVPAGTTVRIFPGPLGGVETPMSLSGGILYVPVVDLFGDYTPSSFDFTTFNIGEGTGELIALDVSTGQQLWSKQLDSINIGGATVVNDLVFTSTMSGMIYAFDKTSGDKLWEYQAPGGINGWPAVSKDFIVFPMGLGPAPKLIAFQIGKATGTTTATSTPATTTTSQTTTITSVEFQADGIISPGEYKYQQKYGDYELYWFNDEENIYVGMKARTTGFVALGIQPGSGMLNADIIFSIVKDGQAEIYDMFSTGIWGPHPQDTALGGTTDITVFGGTEENGYTTIEFKRTLTTSDRYDNPLSKGNNTIIWAYGYSDDLNIQHSTRGYGVIVID